MKLIVGLGNPGPEYDITRHNAGFMVLDQFVDFGWKEKFKGEYAKVDIEGESVILLKPMTYMNLSGESVQPAMKFFKVGLQDVLVVHDELDLPFGAVKLKEGGGTAGHNGLKSIVKHCGGPGFGRLRIGIGRPPRGPVDRYVLSRFDKSEGAELDDVLDRAVQAVRAVMKKGLKAASNHINARS